MSASRPASTVGTAAKPTRRNAEFHRCEQSESISVGIRFRPLNERERADGQVAPSPVFSTRLSLCVSTLVTVLQTSEWRLDLSARTVSYPSRPECYPFGQRLFRIELLMRRGSRLD